jgi:hypothetical protein
MTLSVVDREMNSERGKKSPVRISGPFVSSIAATHLPGRFALACCGGEYAQMLKHKQDLYTCSTTLSWCNH